MSLMQQIKKGTQPAPRRLLLYGTQGIGKSTFAASGKSTIFIQAEDGLGEIGCDKFPLAHSFEEVMTALRELYTQKHDYSTVAVDSLDWLERLIWADVCTERNVTNIEDIGYAKGYTFALDKWRNFLEGLTALRRDKGFTIILIAHAKIEKFENPETESYDRYVPRLHKLASALIQEWCDEVLFATYKIHTKQTDEGFGRKGTRASDPVNESCGPANGRRTWPKTDSTFPKSCHSNGTPTPSTLLTNRKEPCNMVSLGNFNANEVEPNAEFDPVPADKYLAACPDTGFGLDMITEMMYQVFG